MMTLTKDDFLSQIKSSLDNKEIHCFHRIVRDASNQHLFTESHWDLIPLLASYMAADDLGEVFSACNETLRKISQVCDPDEGVLEFIEHAENTNNRVFAALLEIIHILIIRLSGDVSMKILWSFNTILRHLQNIATPTDLKLEANQSALQENQEEMTEIFTLYNEIIVFYQRYLHNELILSNFPSDNINDFNEHSLRFLIQLLGTPFIYCSDFKMLSPGRTMAETILKDIYSFKPDIFSFTSFYYYPSSRKKTLSDFEDDGLSEFENVSLGLLYYLVLYEGIVSDLVIAVYSLTYMFEKVLPSINELLAINHSSTQFKGLHLSLFFLDMFPPKSRKLPSISCRTHSSFCQHVSNCMIYSQVEENRTLALSVFKKYLDTYDANGKYFLLYRIQSSVPQPGFLGFIATLVKDLVNKSLTDHDDEEKYYFQGDYLKQMLTKLCYLKDGVESDFVESSDKVISCLNLLRFLFIKDPLNATGVWDLVPFLKEHYFQKIRKGIEISKAHYKLQLSNLDDKNGENISVTVGGTTLPEMPATEKSRVLNVALNTFDLIESILSRVEEFIEVKN